MLHPLMTHTPEVTTSPLSLSNKAKLHIKNDWEHPHPYVIQAYLFQGHAIIYAPIASAVTALRNIHASFWIAYQG